MPVLQVKAVTADKADMRDVYQCPVYTTEKRFREECFTAQLKYKKDHGELKWILDAKAWYSEYDFVPTDNVK